MRVIINIDVPDLAKGIDFYTKAIGLHHTKTIEDDVAELKGASSTIYLLEKKEGSFTSPNTANARHYTRHWTPVHMDFVVSNLGDAVERALNAGATRESERVEWMGSTCVTFSDPFGHGFCLIEFIDDTYQSPDRVS